ncbi:TetR/AcrR family transcriptional regulator [Dactylosporangium sp. NPDC048998]|uniref:TetR/AcrR family transcriptional regulator n=1 Tax=Dactylosporangium sp. NPDC048998 TaxID=3363976 RepID=UPI003712BCF6
MVRAGLSRAQVCAAALELADEVGIAQLTMTALARRLGVAIPSLYEHVRNMADLLDAAAGRATNEIADRLDAALRGRTRHAALEAYAGTLRAWATAHPGRYAATKRPLSDPEGAASQARIVAGCATLLRGYALEGTLGVDAVRFVHSAVHGFIDIETDGGFHAARNLDVSWAAALAAIDRALTTWPRPAE